MIFDIQIYDILLWLIGLVAGIFLGYVHVSNNQVRADHSRQLIQLPGDWSMLVLIMTIFGFEFFIHYSIEMQWKFSATQVFQVISLIVFGMIVGMSVGRTVSYFCKYKKAISEDLVYG